MKCGSGSQRESPGIVSSPADLDVHPSDHVDEFGHVMKCHCTSFPLCLPRLDNSHRIVAGLETVNIQVCSSGYVHRKGKWWLPLSVLVAVTVTPVGLM